MRRLLPVLLVVFIPTTAHADSANASEGGDGGVPFSYSCGGGAILRGLGARTGSWIDAITPICAVETGRYKGEIVRRPEPWFGGSGGGNTNILCGSGQPVVGIKVSSGMLTEHIRGVTQLVLVCGSAGATGKEFVATQQIGGPDKPKTHRTGLACVTGQVVRGIIGRSGKWLDQIGIICGPPTPPP